MARALPTRDLELDVRGLTADSRAVGPGFLFAALTGTRGDGRAFIPDALSRGAVAVLTDLREPLPAPVAKDGSKIPVIADANPRRRLALMAARFHGAQPKTVAAVTGTSGKTSTVAFTRQIWTALGVKAASMGTLGIVAPGIERKGELTTPDPVVLHGDLAALKRAGIDHLAIEASSHGLDQFRLDGIDIAAAGFTNLSRDHLDYHPDMRAYLAAKLRLFAEVMPAGRAAVLNADAPEFDALASAAAARKHRIIAYGRRGDDLRLDGLVEAVDGQDLTLGVFGRRMTVYLPVAGAFQAHNALCAAGLAIACGAEPERAAAALGALTVVPGRIERVATHPSGAPIYVDYAHKPDALRSILETLRPLARRRLVVVFGAGGDRDAGKRPQMGEIACRLADRVIVTDDNPRGEDPAAIRRAVLAGCAAGDARKLTEIGDRAKAIAAAIEALDAGDVLVIAGKGHEQGQIVGNTVLPFNDAEEARVVVAALARRANFSPDRETGHDR
ncbi:MAG: UDP-N-acetylmuramoyl-L-alanyl-D-glutamate--2,6-diaminopimelate ligase [Alphaproteobacteria bacterium]|nr:UDP-N-acetylmuramoyl-L-alanyl-D-glutamate--2,6-diaminopimelate ligase [Alphaproteobacteria bacterium]